MSCWEEHRLCICGPAVGAGPAAGPALGCGEVGTEACRRHGVDPGEPVPQPLRALCAAALARKRADTSAQVLILHGVRGRDWLHRCGQGGWACHVVCAELCCPERAGHPDFLQALASGFDMVLVEAAEEAAQAAVQRQECALAEDLGGGERIALFASAGDLAAQLALVPAPRPAPLEAPLPAAGRRETVRLSAAALMPDARAPVPLPGAAPYGTVRLDTGACTLCQSCVWLCPADALLLSEDGCELSFAESACIQCGLCAAVCPHRALRLEPRMDLSPAARQPHVLHEAEPHECICCNKPYVPLSTLERLVTRFREGMLDGGTETLPRLFAMCDSCRRAALKEMGSGPGLAVSRLGS
ncbi:4Fe-4S binding protein [Roseobacteraceae bacterium NS-SX3]